MVRLTDFLRAIPKAELHCHLLGSVRQATFTELAARAKAPLTGEEIVAFYTRGEKPAGVLRVLRALGASGSPADFAKFVQREQDRYAVIVKKANIKE